MAAAKETNIAVILKRSLDVDADDAVLAMGALDLVLRDFDKVRAVQHLGERVDQIAIGTFDGCAVEAGTVVEMGLK